MARRLIARTVQRDAVGRDDRRRRRSASRRMLQAAGLAGGAVVFTLACSCNSVAGLGPSNCEVDVADVAPVHYAEGAVEGGIYMSSSWDGELLAFRAGEVLVIDHGLGATPRSIHVWVALADHLGSGEGGSAGAPLSPAAGNQAELLDVNETSLTLHNATCTDYWLLVTADAGGV